MKIIKVRWIDSVGVSAGWTKQTKIPVKYLNTIGYLLEETDDAIYISHTVSPKLGLHYDIFMIPKGAIVEREEL